MQVEAFQALSWSFDAKGFLLPANETIVPLIAIHRSSGDAFDPCDESTFQPGAMDAVVRQIYSANNDTFLLPVDDSPEG